MTLDTRREKSRGELENSFRKGPEGGLNAGESETRGGSQGWQGRTKGGGGRAVHDIPLTAVLRGAGTGSS